MLNAANNILYIRGSAGLLSRHIQKDGNLVNFLQKRIHCNEIIAPYFKSYRKFYQRRTDPSVRVTNSGVLGTLLASQEGAILGSHPTHSFVGVGNQVSRHIERHDHNRSCFDPLASLLDDGVDFSMLLLESIHTSPGFSTVHVAQHKLGLSQLHFARFALRHDYFENGMLKSKVPSEMPGCSVSQEKFYDYYRRDNNFVEGYWSKVPWVFIPSAKAALQAEMRVLKENPRFIKCQKKFCLTCSLRAY